jgi:putative mRNA 3-end processing factor
VWSRRFPDPVTALASGWMRVRARGRQQGVELPLVISDHADWDELCRTILETGAGEVWVTHGQEDALVHWCVTQGLRAKPLHILGYGDEGEGDDANASPRTRGEAETRHRPGEGAMPNEVAPETPPHPTFAPHAGRGGGV